MRLVALSAFVACVVASADARADDAPTPGEAMPQAASDPAFRYVRPEKPSYLRAVIEEATIFGIGVVQYRTESANARDWALPANVGSALGKKLTGKAFSFDNNHFDTNWLTHPFAGYAYYGAVRQNRFGVLPSFVVAVLASTLWELVGELREEAAINDVIATPLTGAVLSESLFQLGSFFGRAKKSATTTALAWALAPFRMAGDATDGAETARATDVDDEGLPADTSHRILLGAGAAITRQENGRTQGDARFHAESRIVDLPDYGKAGRHGAWFGGGEVSAIRLQATTSAAHLTDFSLVADVVAAGYRVSKVDVAPSGLRGHDAIVGLDVGCEYGTHDYDRDRRQRPDFIAMVSTGPMAEATLHRDGVTLRARADALFDFAGVQAYAFPGYFRAYGLAGLPSVLQNEHYYHAIGLTVRPTVELTYGRLDAGANMRFDAFDAIRAADVKYVPAVAGVGASDTRFASRLWTGITFERHVRFSISGEANERAGMIYREHTSRSETSVAFDMDFVF